MTADEKDVIYAKGTIRNFLSNESPATLYFDGTNIQTGEHIKRKIKLSKKVRGWDKEGNELKKEDYPASNKIYDGRLILETWIWEGKNCMRVLNFEINECLGSSNPFDAFDKIEDEIDNFSLI